MGKPNYDLVRNEYSVITRSESRSESRSETKKNWPRNANGFKTISLVREHGPIVPLCFGSYDDSVDTMMMRDPSSLDDLIERLGLAVEAKKKEKNFFAARQLFRVKHATALSTGVPTLMDKTETVLMYAQSMNSFWGMFYAEFYFVFNYFIRHSLLLLHPKLGYEYNASRRLVSESNVDAIVLDTVGSCSDFFSIVVRCTQCLLSPVGSQHLYVLEIHEITEAMMIVLDSLCGPNAWLGSCDMSTGALLSKPRSYNEGVHVSHWNRLRLLLINLSQIMHMAVATTKCFLTVCAQLGYKMSAFDEKTLQAARNEDQFFFGYRLRQDELHRSLFFQDKPAFATWVPFSFNSFAAHLAHESTLGEMTDYLNPFYRLRIRIKRANCLTLASSETRRVIECFGLGADKKQFMQSFLERSRNEYNKVRGIKEFFAEFEDGYNEKRVIIKSGSGEISIWFRHCYIRMRFECKRKFLYNDFHGIGSIDQILHLWFIVLRRVFPCVTRGIEASDNDIYTLIREAKKSAKKREIAEVVAKKRRNKKSKLPPFEQPIVSPQMPLVQPHQPTEIPPPTPDQPHQPIEIPPPTPDQPHQPTKNPPPTPDQPHQPVEIPPPIAHAATAVQIKQIVDNAIFNLSKQLEYFLITNLHKDRYLLSQIDINTRAIPVCIFETFPTILQYTCVIFHVAKMDCNAAICAAASISKLLEIVWIPTNWQQHFPYGEWQPGLFIAGIRAQ